MTEFAPTPHHPMRFVTKYTPEQWAEARRLRADGLTFVDIAQRLGFATSNTLSAHFRKMGWIGARGKTVAGAVKSKGSKPSPATVSIRRKLSVRLYTYVELQITMMELRMKKRLDAYANAPAGTELPPFTKSDVDEFAALIQHINQVTEMASEPASAAAGGRKSATNPELTALSSDIDPDGLAIASEKDNLRAELADRLGKMFPQS
jgi:hypothetical protein